MKTLIDKKTGSVIEPTAYKMLIDCELMADYAMDSGKDIPQWLAESLVKISSSVDDLKQELFDASSSKKLTDKTGFEIKNKISNKLKSETDKLSKIYSKLIEIVAPASPLSIEFTKPSVGFFFKGKKRYRL